jgi:hypothetical protein
MMVKMLGLEDVELSLRFGELGLEGTDWVGTILDLKDGTTVKIVLGLEGGDWVGIILG